jgi:hypothetical protein
MRWFASPWTTQQTTRRHVPEDFNLQQYYCENLRTRKRFVCLVKYCRSQWPRGLRRGSAVARPAKIVGSNPTGGVDVCCECCVLSGRGLCDGLITSPEESYRLWRVVVCDLETSWMRRSLPNGGAVAPKTNKDIGFYFMYQYYKQHVSSPSFSSCDLSRLRSIQPVPSHISDPTTFFHASEHVLFRHACSVLRIYAHVHKNVL